MKALILNDQIIEICAEVFSVHPSLKWVSIPQDLEITREWIYINGQFIPPQITNPQSIKTELEKKVEAMWQLITTNDDGLLNTLKGELNAKQ